MPNFMINPGTGAVEGASEANAVANLPVLLADAGLTGIGYGRAPEYDDGKGRYAFRVFKVGAPAVIVLMVGLPLVQVRYLDVDEQNPFDYPRLYVNGSSWLWTFAASMLHAAINEEE